jgi:hypothetical protein
MAVRNSFYTKKTTVFLKTENPEYGQLNIISIDPDFNLKIVKGYN